MATSREEAKRAAEDASRKAKDGAGGKINGQAPPEPRKLDFIWADDIVLDLDSAQLIDGLLGANGLTVIYGDSTVGKTFVAIDIASHIAALMPWRGLDVEGGVAVYLAAEAPKSVERRIWAWKDHHEVDHLPILVIRSHVNLLTNDTDAIIALLNGIRAQYGRIALVVIDTLARAMSGNENSSEDMGGYVNACGRIVEAAGTNVLSVHHCGKDTARGARGWSGLRAATDVELEIAKTEDGSGSITVCKTRDEKSGTVYGYRLKEVELGVTKKGRVKTTCVAVSSEAATGSRKGPPPTGHQRTVLDALVKAIAADGGEGPPLPEIPRWVRGVSVDRWQAEADRMLADQEPKRRTETFGRARDKLIERGHVLHIQRFAWVA